jgi:hypothetical protein
MQDGGASDEGGHVTTLKERRKAKKKNGRKVERKEGINETSGECIKT